MLQRLIDYLNDEAFPPVGEVFVLLALFVLAWLVSRLAGWLANWILGWQDRREAARGLEETGRIADLKRRETIVRVVRGAIAYVAFLTAVVAAVALLTGGFDRLAAIVGASFAVIVAGFATQRILADVIAGFTMFLERWYSVGDTVVLHAGSELQGVVEDVTLRKTRLRTIAGEVVHVNNSAIGAARVLPRGSKRLAIELFVSDRDAGEHLVSDVAWLVPTGPTMLLERPAVHTVEELAGGLTRISVRATVVPGREWLVEGFLCDLLRERAEEGLIVHGPVTLTVDERVTRSYARSTAGRRWRSSRAAGSGS